MASEEENLSYTSDILIHQNICGAYRWCAELCFLSPPVWSGQRYWWITGSSIEFRHSFKKRIFNWNPSIQSIIPFFQPHFSLSSLTNLVSDCSALHRGWEWPGCPLCNFMVLDFIFINSEGFVANQHYCVTGVSCWKKANILITVLQTM